MRKVLLFLATLAIFAVVTTAVASATATAPTTSPGVQCQAVGTASTVCYLTDRYGAAIPNTISVSISQSQVEVIKNNTPGPSVVIFSKAQP